METAHPGKGKRIFAIAVLLCVGGGVAWLQDARGVLAQGAGPRHRMTKITDTIYRADAVGSPGINSTSWVFINDADVLVTDSEGTTASARSLLAGIATITAKPVRYLVDTHFHIDHAYGNAALPASVQIIGSDFTRRFQMVDGLVRFAALPSSRDRSDRWTVNERTGRLVSVRSGASVGLGDQIGRAHV